MTADSLVDRISGWLTGGSSLEMILTILAVCVGCFLLACLLRLLGGKGGTAVGGVTATLDIIVFYVLIVLLPTLFPILENHLPALPCISVNADVIHILPIAEVERSVLYPELVNMIILAFLFCLTEVIFPEGRNIIVWLLLRLVSCIVVCLIMGFFQWLSTDILTGFIPTYAPIILLVLLAVLLAVTVFKWFFGLVLGLSLGPVAGAIYTFFVSNIIGKQLMKSVLSSALVITLLILIYQHEKTIHLGSFPALILILAVFFPIVSRYFISRLF